jgi:hypothetical protein
MFTTMEVASPLAFGHVKAGSKRRLACSPLDTSATVDDYAMDDSASYGQSFKRRRCDNMEMSIAPQQSFAAANPFAPSGESSSIQKLIPFTDLFQTWTPSLTLFFFLFRAHRNQASAQ